MTFLYHLFRVATVTVTVTVTPSSLSFQEVTKPGGYQQSRPIVIKIDFFKVSVLIVETRQLAV